MVRKKPELLLRSPLALEERLNELVEFLGSTSTWGDELAWAPKMVVEAALKDRLLNLSQASVRISWERVVDICSLRPAWRDQLVALVQNHRAASLSKMICASNTKLARLTHLYELEVTQGVNLDCLPGINALVTTGTYAGTSIDEAVADKIGMTLEEYALSFANHLDSALVEESL